MRDSVLRVVKGRASARQAPVEMYGASGYTVVPSLRFSSQRETRDALGAAEANPLLFSPIYRLATRIGGLPIRTYELLPEMGPQPQGQPQELPSNVTPLERARSRGVHLAAWNIEAMRQLGRDEAPLHPGHLLLIQPNALMTRQSLFAGTTASMLIHGRAAWLKDRSAEGEPPTELWPIPANKLFPHVDPKGLIDYFELRGAGVRTQRLEVKDVCYFRLMPSFSDWASGASPLQALGKVAEFGEAALSALTELFNTGILSPLWIDLHGKELSTKALQRLRAAMAAARSDRYGIPIMEGGATLEELGSGPSTELMTTSATMAQNLIAEAFGLPLDGDPKRFYSEAVQPIADAIETELVRSLFSEWPERPAFAEFQFRDILKGSPAERIALHRDAILSGQETINEARRDENRPPIEGGDVAYVPLNVLPIQTAQSTLERPRADTKGGLGGDEGKGTFVSAPGGGRGKGMAG